MKRLAFVLVAACTASPTGPARLSDEVKLERYTLIRDTAAQMGMYNAALLAGIAISETGLAHCQAEATYACPGPASSSCDGGPIIAGAADGPCADMQGGLGMFQFDAGTYAQTLAAYGPQILTIEGNSAQAVSFVVDKVILDVPGVGDWLAADAWMNQVPLQAGAPVMEQWAALLACRYNGCCSASATCTARANGYRDNAITAFADEGAAFWTTAGRCAALPDDGIIDQRTECYIAGGDPRHWRRETAGYDGGREWTLATDAATPANFGEWIIKTGARGRYHVEIYVDGGGSTQAAYQIAHGGAIDTVIVNQASATGFVSLGDFELTGSGDEHVLLGDNTGEPSSTNKKLMFDAVRVRPVGSTDSGGGCSVRGYAVGGIALALGVLLARRRRVS